jgi:hypothetical protein
VSIEGYRPHQKILPCSETSWRSCSASMR